MAAMQDDALSEQRHRMSGQLTPLDDLAHIEVNKHQNRSSARKQERGASGCAPARVDPPECFHMAADATGSSRVSKLDIDHIGIVSEAASFSRTEIRAPGCDERLVSDIPHRGWELRAGVVLGVVMTVIGFGSIGGWSSFDFVSRALTSKTVLSDVVERIIHAESNGCPNAKNTRSSAMGAGQFLDQTWLHLIRVHRPELARGSEREALELRRDPKLAREITLRLAEHNASLLRARGLPVTRGTLYLSHFAGGAGAVALLAAPDNADAAAIMASADATGRTTRAKIVNANPFLQRFTVTDLKSWADRKMHNPGFRMADLVPGNRPGARPATKICL
jgi:hypothetical protein